MITKSNARELLESISEMLAEHHVNIDDMIHLKMINQRANGKEFPLNEHIRALIHSLLTNQTRWSRIVHNLPKIDTNWEVFYEGIFFNAAIFYIKNQMWNLYNNINTMQMIVSDCGSMDNYVTSDVPIEIAKSFAVKGKYKLNSVGIPLALEYLRNVGINEIKPDVHIRRILSHDRLRLSENENVG